MWQVPPSTLLALREGASTPGRQSTGRTASANNCRWRSLSNQTLSSAGSSWGTTSRRRSVSHASLQPPRWHTRRRSSSSFVSHDVSHRDSGDWRELTKKFTQNRKMVIDSVLASSSGVKARRFSFSFAAAKYHRKQESSLVRKLQTDVKGDISADWIAGYRRDKGSFRSIEQFAVTKLNELSDHDPDETDASVHKLRLAVCCDVLEDVLDFFTPSINVSLKNRLKLELFRGIYVDLWEHAKDRVMLASKLGNEAISFGIAEFCRSVPYFVVSKTMASAVDEKQRKHHQKVTYKIIRGALKVQNKVYSKFFSEPFTHSFTVWRKYTQYCKKKRLAAIRHFQRVAQQGDRRQQKTVFLAWKRWLHEQKNERVKLQGVEAAREVDRQKEIYLAVLRELGKRDETIVSLRMQLKAKTAAKVHQQWSPERVNVQRRLFVSIQQLRDIKKEFSQLTRGTMYKAQALKRSYKDDLFTLSVEELCLRWLQHHVEMIYDDLGRDAAFKFDNFTDDFQRGSLWLTLFQRMFGVPSQGLFHELLRKCHPNNSGFSSVLNTILTTARKFLDEDDQLGSMLTYFRLKQNDGTLNFVLLAKLMITSPKLFVTRDDLLLVFDRIQDAMTRASNMVSKPLNALSIPMAEKLVLEVARTLDALRKEKEDVLAGHMQWVQLAAKTELHVQRLLHDHALGRSPVASEPVHLLMVRSMFSFKLIEVKPFFLLNDSQMSYVAKTYERDGVPPQDPEALALEEWAVTRAITEAHKDVFLRMLQRYFDGPTLSLDNWRQLCKDCHLETKRHPMALWETLFADLTEVNTKFEDVYRKFCDTPGDPPQEMAMTAFRFLFPASFGQMLLIVAALVYPSKVLPSRMVKALVQVNLRRAFCASSFPTSIVHNGAVNGVLVSYDAELKTIWRWLVGRRSQSEQQLNEPTTVDVQAMVKLMSSTSGMELERVKSVCKGHVVDTTQIMQRVEFSGFRKIVCELALDSQRGKEATLWSDRVLKLIQHMCHKLRTRV